MHGTHDRAFLFNERFVTARLQPDRQRLVIDLGFEAHVVEVFIQSVELVQANGVDRAPQVGTHATEQIAASRRILHPALGLGTVVSGLNRGIDNRRATAATGLDRRAQDEALVFEDAHVIARGVDVNARVGREILEEAAGATLDRMQQSQSAHLGEPAIITNPARHIAHSREWMLQRLGLERRG